MALLLAATVAAAGCRSGATLRLGAVADAHGAAAATLANLGRACGVFSSEHVDAVLALGDLGETEDEIAAVLTGLGAARAPVYALPGELEPENAFHAAVKRARNAGVEVVDLVDNREVRLRDSDIVAIPGYPFSHRGYKYGTADLERAKKLAAGRHGALVVAAHAPPKGQGKDAADWATGDVNAGDPALAELVRAIRPNATLFAHVDEAGGRTEGGAINVGSIAGSVDDGAGAMAALVEIVDGGAARARVLR